MNARTAHFAMQDSAARAARERTFKQIAPLRQYDVEHSLPWFPWACFAVTLAGAFGPLLIDLVRDLL